MHKSIIIAAFVAATACTAVAKEVCRDVQVKQINCKTVNGQRSCWLSYETAQICKQVPDTPGKAAAISRSDQLMLVQV